MAKKIALNKYSFLSYFKGNWSTWLQSEDNFRELANLYPKMMKELDEFKFETAVNGKKWDELDHIKQTQITDGLNFGDVVISEYKKKYSHLKVYDFDKRPMWEWKEIVKESIEMINSGEDFISFEPAFTLLTPKGQEFKTRVDVLVRENGVLYLLEAKATGWAKKEYAFDLFYQWKLINELFKTPEREVIIEPENCRLITLDQRHQADNSYEITAEWDGYLDYKPYKNKPSRDEVLPWMQSQISFQNKFRNTIGMIDETIDFYHVLNRIEKIQQNEIDTYASKFLFETPEESWGTNSTRFKRGFRFFADKFKGDHFEPLFIKLMHADGHDSIFNIKGPELSFEEKTELWFEGREKLSQLQAFNLMDSWTFENKMNSNQDEATAQIVKLSKQMDETGMKVGNKALEEMWTLVNDKELIDKQALKYFANKLKFPIYMIGGANTRIAIQELGNYRPYEEIAINYSIQVAKSAEDLLSGVYEHRQYTIENYSNIGLNFFERMIKDLSFAGRGTWVSFRGSMDKELLLRAIELNLIPEGEVEKVKLIHNELVDMSSIFKERAIYNKQFKGGYEMKDIINRFVKLPEQAIELISKKENYINDAKRWLLDSKLKQNWESKKQILESVTRLETTAMLAILKMIKNV